MKHKFFRDARIVCLFCNSNNIEIVSITFVPKGGWCLFYKEKG